MASARKTGVNESTSTYGAGQTYVDGQFATWESDTDNNNVTGNVSPVLACLAGIYDDGAALAGATNDATRFRIIRPQAGNFHTGIRDTGVRFYETTNVNQTISIGENNSQIQDVCLRITNNSASTRSCLTLSTLGSTAAVGVIVTGATNAGAGLCIGFNITGTSFLIDCLGENCDDYQFNINTSGTATWYNCTAIGGTHGFRRSAATLVVKNCLASDTSTNDFEGTMTQTNCASQDATATGTGCRASQTFTFVDAANKDYHLAASDGGAKGFGTNLSADATYAFDDDIDRQLFGAAWDIGFDAVISTFIAFKGLNTWQAVNRAAVY